MNKSDKNLALVDTNVLVYALFQDSEYHHASRSLLDQAQNDQIALCLTPQILAEFYSVVTDSKRVTSSRKPEEAIEAIEKFLAMPGITLLPIPFDVVTRWTTLIRHHPVTGGAIFDVQLIATMLGNEICRIYTFNSSDFEKFDNIEVLEP